MTARKSKRATRDQCDTVWGRIIRAPGVCCNCGSTEVIQAAHGFSRSYAATRHDLRNGFPLCRADHVYYTHRPLEWADWLIEKWGPDLFAELRALALTHKRPDYEVVLAELKAHEKALAA
jgi:hypothetical protein